jgi:hypothetical protein
MGNHARRSFDDAAVETTQAKTWPAALNAEQADLLQKMETAKQLAQKDVEIEQATATAQTERAAKEELVAANAKQARRMPVSVTMERAKIGRTLTLVLQTTQKCDRALRCLERRSDVLA